MRLIYVKHGAHLLARLPMVPGLATSEEAVLPSDDKRMETEAFVKGMESTVMDLVARREILRARPPAFAGRENGSGRRVVGRTESPADQG